MKRVAWSLGSPVKTARFLLSGAMLLALTTACSSSHDSRSGLVDGLDPATEEHVNYVAVDTNPPVASASPDAASAANDSLRDQLGTFFLVEHFNVEVNPTMKRAIAAHQPGGILFWDANHADSLTVRRVVREYSIAAKEAHHQSILFSVDYEGGGLSFSPANHSIPGVQRFHQGFTQLAHPIWLGLSMPRFGTELCRLHGEIMARELTSVGINYPLSVISDQATRLFLNRGVGTNPAQITECMQAIMASFVQQRNIVLVTKHFPGLGQTRGDSHEGVARSTARTQAESAAHAAPFADMITSVNANNTWPQYSIMASHGLFPLYDPNTITTESPILLHDVLRTQLGFRGIVVSDAMWMGSYGSLAVAPLMKVYVKSFLAGMDMLMIPGSRFAPAVTYFRSVYDNTLDESAKAQLSSELGQPWDEIRQSFIARVRQSLARINQVRGTIPAAVDTIAEANVVPSSLTTQQRARYREILQATDTRWASHLSPE